MVNGAGETFMRGGREVVITSGHKLSHLGWLEKLEGEGLVIVSGPPAPRTGWYFAACDIAQCELGQVSVVIRADSALFYADHREDLPAPCANAATGDVWYRFWYDSGHERYWAFNPLENSERYSV